MDILDGLKKRRSVRVFAKKAVPRETLEQIVDCARFAPTARNEQPWEFVVLTDPARIKKLAELTDYGRFIANAPACVAVLCADTKYYLEDGSAATMNLQMAAMAFGIGSCWVAGDKKSYSGQINEFLGVPAQYKLVSLVPLGFPDNASIFREIDKRPLAELLHWEKY